MKVVPAILVTTILSTAGCASFTSPAREHVLEPGKSYWLDYDASRRGALLVVRSDGTLATCSEPSPDVALNLVNKLEGNLKADNIELANAKGEVSISALKLAERTQMVMFLRESLYRLCELSINHKIEQDRARELYSMVIKTAYEMEQRANAETIATAEKAKAENQRLEVTNKLIHGMDRTQIQRLLKPE